jgi:hypothetical protein
MLAALKVASLAGELVGKTVELLEKFEAEPSEIAKAMK